MNKIQKKAIVVHSGGMDSSICLAQAIKEHGASQVLSLSFSYSQRHSNELEQAKIICQYLAVDHVIVPISGLGQITDNALINESTPIEKIQGVPNTLVVGRNGLMARLAAIHADSLGANEIWIGVIEVEEANSGYRDCSRVYMDKMQEILQMDLDNPDFVIKTPLVKMTKKQTMELAEQLGFLEYFLENTISCYEGLAKQGCGKCPACHLRNQGIREYLLDHPEFELSFKSSL